MAAPETGGRRPAAAFEPPLGWRVPVALAAGATVFALDYLTKAIVKNTLAVTGESVSVLPGILSFRFVANTGAAFSMGEGMGLVFVALAVAVTVAIAWYLLRAPQVSRLETLALGLVAGGAIGNALDRLVLGYVVDFIATDFIAFPVFNIADIGVTVGVALAFFAFLFLSPGSKVDATEELNRRDRAREKRHADARARRAERASARARGHRSTRSASDARGGGSASGEGRRR